MEREVALHFRDELRHARAVALKDSESFEHIVYVFERFGMFLTHSVLDLGKYQERILREAVHSPLAAEIPGRIPQLHAPFNTLYDLVREARNDALHQGAFARHLTRHAIELALVLEDALMVHATVARDFMVKDPICARLWEPISAIRRSMLENSFSFLPVAMKSSGHPGWALVADFSLAAFLRAANNNADRKRRLASSLGEVVEAGQITLSNAITCHADDHVSQVLQSCKGQPVLVISPDHNLLGIITPFDLL